jgi:hypothetical protein
MYNAVFRLLLAASNPEEQQEAYLSLSKKWVGGTKQNWKTQDARGTAVIPSLVGKQQHLYYRV